MYKDCIRAEMHGVAGGPEVSGGPCDDTDQGTAREEQLSQRRTDSLKTKRRKSMSFWEHWSKSREQLESEPCTAQSSDKGGCTLTRVIFPDKATTVVTTNTGESIRALISRLLEKRSLRLTSFDVFSTASQGGPLDLSEDCAILHCTEVKIEARVLFRLELPSHKSIGVKVRQLIITEEIEYHCDVCRLSKPKQSARFLLQFCSSTDGISMKWMCMWMRIPPSRGLAMIKLISAIMWLSLITKGYLLFRSRAPTLKRLVS